MINMTVDATGMNQFQKKVIRTNFECLCYLEQKKLLVKNT